MASPLTNTHIIFVLGVVALTMSGCSKDMEDNSMKPSPSIADLNSFSPEPNAIPDLIRKQHRARENYLVGAKSNEDVRLDIALWMNEALMNYMKGDANRFGYIWLKGDVTYSFPIYQKEDGLFYVNNNELINAYEDAIEKIELAGVNAKVYALNHTIVSVANNIATVLIEWTDGVDTDEFPATSDLNGSGFGCVDVQTAARALQFLAGYNFNSARPEGSTIVTLSAPNLQITTNTGIGTVNGNLMYVGTNETLNGPHWLYSGSNGPNMLCFPYRWEKYLELRDFYLNQWQLPTHVTIIKEEFDWTYFPLTGQPTQYGSIYYPMGPYDHTWFPVVGYILQPFTL